MCDAEVETTPSSLPFLPKEETFSLKQLIQNQNWKEAALRISTPRGVKETRTTDQYGRLPLHDACIFCAPSKTIVRPLLKLHPGAVRVPDWHGMLPIHGSCYHGAPLDVIHALLEEYPESASRANFFGMLPLHCACFTGASVLAIKALIAAYPGGSMTPDSLGRRLPLHYASYGVVSVDALKALLEVYPEAAREKDGAGRLPLHHACVRRAHVDIVCALLHIFPNAARILLPDGRLPIHVEMARADQELRRLRTRNADDQTVSFLSLQPLQRKKALVTLLDADPNGANVPDSAGRSWTTTFLCTTRNR